MNDSLTEMQVLSECAKVRGLTRGFVYRGPSMLPTFRNGHLLYVRPMVRNLAAGDVIVFEDVAGGEHIVHRIISIKDDVILTRGDNNRIADPTPVQSDQIIGRVEAVEDRRGLRSVWGGRRGMLKMKMRRAFLQTNNLLWRILQRPYNILRDRRLAARIWHPSITKVEVQTKEGPVVKYIHQRRTVAVWHPSQRTFSCRKPYDLVIPAPDKGIE